MKTEAAILQAIIIVQPCVAQILPAVSERMLLAATKKKDFEEIGV
jgi:hypothetical protein